MGMRQYAAAFRDNGIGADVLADLTEADLEKLGLKLGDRKRLLKAIAALGAEPAPPDTPTGPLAALFGPCSSLASRAPSPGNSVPL